MCSSGIQIVCNYFNNTCRVYLPCVIDADTSRYFSGKLPNHENDNCHQMKISDNLECNRTYKKKELCIMLPSKTQFKN